MAQGHFGTADTDPREIEMCLNCKNPKCDFGRCLNVMRLKREIVQIQRGGWEPGKCYTYDVEDGVTYTVRELVSITGRADSTIRRWIKDGNFERIKREIREAKR